MYDTPRFWSCRELVAQRLRRQQLLSSPLNHSKEYTDLAEQSIHGRKHADGKERDLDDDGRDEE